MSPPPVVCEPASVAGAPLQVVPVPLSLARRRTRFDEVDDLVALLTEFADPAAGAVADIARTAETVAVACLGDNHLWQDLQLPSRAGLSALMNHWFPALAARNNRDMKWKKFLYKQLCEREQVFVCRSPSCVVCTDYDKCFGSEDAGGP